MIKISLLENGEIFHELFLVLAIHTTTLHMVANTWLWINTGAIVKNVLVNSL